MTLEEENARLKAENATLREQMTALVERVQEVTGAHVELAYLDQGYTGAASAEAAATHAIQLEVVKLPAAKRDFAWAARFRRLARDYERLAATLFGLYFVVFPCLMLRHWIHLPRSS